MQLEQKDGVASIEFTHGGPTILIDYWRADHAGFWAANVRGQSVTVEDADIGSAVVEAFRQWVKNQ